MDRRKRNRKFVAGEPIQFYDPAANTPEKQKFRVNFPAELSLI